MKVIVSLAALFSIFLGTQAHAVQTCVLTIPSDCELLNMEYEANPHDTTHVIQVTCRTRDGSIASYLTSRQAIISTIFGLGRDFLPHKITYATWGRDAIQIDCR